MILILLLWILLFLCGSGKNKEDRPALEQGQSIALRGICAIEIMIGHIGLATGSTILYPNRKAGILFVGIFFMISGYGIAYGAEHKPGYFRRFILKKAARLIFPAYVAYVIYTAVLIFIFGKAEWMGLFDMSAFFHKTNWYVWEQMALYILVWLVYTRMSKHANLFIAVVSVVFVGMAFVLEVDNPYYGSTLCFALGLYYYQFENRLTQVFDRHFIALFLSFGTMLLLSLGLFFVLGNDSVLGNPIARNVASVSFCVVVLLLLGKFKVGGTAAHCLGIYSYEIFLVHPYVLSLLKHVDVTSQFVYGIACIVISLLAAFILHEAMRTVIRH